MFLHTGALDVAESILTEYSYDNQGNMLSDGNVATGTFTGNMQMTIEAPQGSNALDVAPISQYTGESEILFNVGQRMQITAAENRNGVLYISVRIQ